MLDARAVHIADAAATGEREASGFREKKGGSGFWGFP